MPYGMNGIFTSKIDTEGTATGVARVAYDLEDHDGVNLPTEIIVIRRGKKQNAQSAKETTIEYFGEPKNRSRRRRRIILPTETRYPSVTV